MFVEYWVSFQFVACIGTIVGVGYFWLPLLGCRFGDTCLFWLPFWPRSHGDCLVWQVGWAHLALWRMFIPLWSTHCPWRAALFCSYVPSKPSYISLKTATIHASVLFFIGRIRITFSSYMYAIKMYSIPKYYSTGKRTTKSLYMTPLMLSASVE